MSVSPVKTSASISADHEQRSIETRIGERNRGVPKEAPAQGRIAALDFTKGALVLIMVLYHWLNYFAGPEGSYYRYLAFLPPSFICIAGFLISHVYFSKYRATDAKLPFRLLVRGLKIMAIFVGLNILIGAAAFKADGGKRLLEMFSPAGLWAIYASGNMLGGKLVAFYVLLPISYVLILSAGLLVASRRFRGVFHAATAAGLAGVAALTMLGEKSRNLELLTVGLLGISIGYIPIESINGLLRRYWLVGLAYLFYVVAITIWNTPYSLQVTGVLVTLMLLYALGMRSGEQTTSARTVILLGKYSLFAYIAQIAILQVMRRMVSENLPAWAQGVTFLAATALTIAAVEVTNRLRKRSGFANRIYSAVFA